MLVILFRFVSSNWVCVMKYKLKLMIGKKNMRKFICYKICVILINVWNIVLMKYLLVFSLLFLKMYMLYIIFFFFYKDLVKVLLCIVDFWFVILKCLFELSI